MTKTDVSCVFGEASGYTGIHGDIVALLEGARHAAARSVNAVMTASYWEIGRRIVEFEQGGQDRAVYRHALLKRLSVDLMRRFCRGFSERNLEQMRLFYLTWPPGAISQTPSAKLEVSQVEHATGESAFAPISKSLNQKSGALHALTQVFPLQPAASS